MNRTAGPLAVVLALAPWTVAAAQAPAQPPGQTPAQTPAQPPSPQDQADAVRRNAARLGEQAREPLEPLPEGQVRVLRAVVMEVEGRAQWRANAADPYRLAKIDDVLVPGTMIRTGRQAKLTIRLGHNATIMIDRQTRVTLPEIVQAGASLRTTVSLTRGRADVKVDRIELSNDFSVVTPSTTLAVRGTGYGVRYGGLRGTEAFAARTNEIRSIEVRYFLSRLSYLLSAGDTSGSVHEHPALAALYDTFGPPPLIDGLLEADATPELLAEALARSPIVDQRKEDLGLTGVMTTTGNPMFVPPEEGPPAGPNAALAEFICQELTNIFGLWTSLLGDQDFDTSGIPALQMQIQAFCADIPPGTFVDTDLQAILEDINAFCAESQNLQLCNDLFLQAVDQVADPPG